MPYRAICVALLGLLSACATRASTADPVRPAHAAQQKCPAPKPFAAEAKRILELAANHASRSGACYDGSGNRYKVSQVEICTQRIDQREASMQVRYSLTRLPEGDTRGCGREPGDCDWTKPTTARHTVTFKFAAGQRGYLALLPKRLPGMPLMTALDKPHNGDCYGKSPPIVPNPIPRN